jgi:porin
VSRPAFLFLAFVHLSGVAHAQDTGDRTRPTFGGPDNVEQQLDDDADNEDSLLDHVFFDPYFGFKERVRDTVGLGFGIDYSTVVFSVSDTPGEERAAGGMVRLYGAWELVGRDSPNSGSLIYKVEHRHRYTNLAPKDFSFDFGYAGLIAPPFSDQQTRLTNLYWRQRFLDGRIAVVGGFLDTTDYVDVYALASPWLHFQNLVFSTGSATIPLPDDATFGIAGAAMVTNNVYVIGGIADTNANAADPFRSAESFFTTAEHFAQLEVGWTSSQQRIIFDNVHVTFWHADEREKAQVLGGWGVNCSASTFLNESFMPFVRGGYAKDGGSLLQRSLSAGLGHYGGRGSDVLGVAYNWGEPNETTFAPELSTQHGLELFYRLQVTNELAITPNLEYIRNPALQPDQDSIWLFGLRARLAL